MKARMRQTESISARLLGSVLRLALIALVFPSPGKAQDQEATKKTRVTKPPPASAGRRVFESRCAACHGPNGRGGEHAPAIVVNPNLRAVSDQTLFQIIRDGIPRRGMPGFNSVLTQGQIHEVVVFLRHAAHSESPAATGRRPLTASRGEPKRGEALFFGKAGCGDCHSLGGRGGFLGQDLSGYGRDLSPGIIREAIVNPNHNLSRDRQVVLATTRDGREFTGIARNEDNFSVQLLDRNGDFHLLMKSDLADLKHEPRSLMPHDYSARLSATELEDLVSYLATRQ
jgi:putative heme-binding domain-containing protein